MLTAELATQWNTFAQVILYVDELTPGMRTELDANIRAFFWSPWLALGSNLTDSLRILTSYVMSIIFWRGPTPPPLALLLLTNTATE
jgi:hypothetical protein